MEDSEHDAWLAYRRAKYGPDAPDLCCDPPTQRIHALLTATIPGEVLATAA